MMSPLSGEGLLFGEESLQSPYRPRPPSLPSPDAPASGNLAIINGATLTALVPMKDAIELVSQAMIDLSDSRVIAPERWAVALTGDNRLGIMPGAMSDRGCYGVKLISLFPSQAGPSHQGLMLLFDLTTGAPVAVVDAAVLTGLRTAAATAVATRALAPRAAATAALLGCGDQARWHIDALLAVRPIKAFHLWSRSAARAEALAAEIRRRPGVTATVHAEARTAVEASEIICTLSASSEPILNGAWLRSGQHINLVGSSNRFSRELDDHGVERAYYVGDAKAHVLSQAGELRHAIETGTVSETHFQAEIGEVLADRCAGRTDDAMITLYKSLGHVVQDLSVAQAALIRGMDAGLVSLAPWL